MNSGNIGKEIAQRLDEALDQSQDEEEKAWSSTAPVAYNHASELGWVRDCPRYLCLRRLCPEKEAARDTAMRRRMREGKKQEALIRADLGEAGIKVVHRGRLTWEKYKLTGEVDDELYINDNIVPVDYKTCSSSMFPIISKAECKEHLLDSRYIWLRHYPAQISCYVLMLQRDTGILLFKNKDAGLYHPIDIPLDVAYASELLDGIQDVNEAVDKDDAFKAEYKDVCQSCGFFSFDFPDTDKATMAQADIEIITDQEWVEKLTAHKEFIDAGIKEKIKMFEAIDREIKDAFVGRKVMIGSHLVESKPYLQVAYDVPKDIKEQYKKQVERHRATIKHLAEVL